MDVIRRIIKGFTASYKMMTLWFICIHILLLAMIALKMRLTGNSLMPYTNVGGLVTILLLLFLGWNDFKDKMVGHGRFLDIMLFMLVFGAAYDPIGECLKWAAASWFHIGLEMNFGGKFGLETFQHDLDWSIRRIPNGIFTALDMGFRMCIANWLLVILLNWSRVIFRRRPHPQH